MPKGLPTSYFVRLERLRCLSILAAAKNGTVPDRYEDIVARVRDGYVVNGDGVYEKDGLLDEPQDKGVT
jgi:hypothetical protein